VDRDKYREGTLAAKGFKEDPRRQTWFNPKARKSLSHQAIRDYDEASWKAPLSSIVPAGEFWFYSSGGLALQVCEEQLALWGLETLRPVIKLPAQFAHHPMIVANIDDPKYWEPLTDDQVIEKMQGGQAGSPIWNRGEAELKIREFRRSRQRHEEEMAKKNTPKPTPATLDSKEAIRVLRKLRDKGNALLLHHPLEKNGAETWSSMGRELLIKAFGSDSDRIREFADWPAPRCPSDHK